MHDFARRIIPLARNSAYAGQEVTVSGWGYVQLTPGGGAISPSVLQYLDKRIVSRSECEMRTGYPIPPSTVCTTSALGAGSCMGDSGKLFQSELFAIY